MYALLKPALFRLEPEAAHELTLRGLSAASRQPEALAALRRAYGYTDPRLGLERFGLRFANPIGLAAGLDKNARALGAWEALGFGFAEVGSVTAFPQPGNPKPRLIRLPKDEALINRMGFNNDGAEAVARRLDAQSQSGRRPKIPIGVNIGKSALTPLEDAPADYRRSLELLWDQGDYFVLNVSSPNTVGLRSLQEQAPLAYLLSSLHAASLARQPRPLLLKIAPDLSFGEIDGVLEVALRYGVAGIIAVNTTVARDTLSSAVDEPGGLSGGPLRARALAVLRHLRQVLGASLPIISVGGLSDPDDAAERLAAGASLLQVYTGLVYRGPGLVKTLKQGIAARLEREGMTRLDELIGSAA